MANKKMTDFRKGKNEIATKGAAKQAIANMDVLFQRVETLTNLVLGVSKKMFEMDGRLRTATRTSNACDWRTLAIVDIMDEMAKHGHPGFSKNIIAARAEKLQVENFEKDAAEFDRINGLIAVVGHAENGHYATVSIDYFKDGVKLDDQKTVRSKIHLGQHELFPELDEQIMGMKVGEKKMFPLNMMGMTDSAELELLDLKKAQPKEAPNGSESTPQG